MMTKIIARLCCLFIPMAIIGCCLMPVAEAVRPKPELPLGKPVAVRIDEPVIYQEPYSAYEGGEYTYYREIPLDRNIQYFVQNCCLRYNVSFPLVLGVMEIESAFDETADSGWAYGLMQVGYINHGTFLDAGMDPITTTGNIEAGVYMLSDLIARYQNIGRALMAYNCGETGAGELWEDGIVTTDYTNDVLSAAARWQQQLKEKAQTAAS